MKQDLLEKFKNTDWRLRNLYKIIDKNANLIQFKPNPIQETLNRSTAKRRRILKARQFGITTNEMIRLFDLAVWGKNLNICILAHDQDTIKKIFKIIRNAYDTMNPRFRPKLDKGGGSQYEMRFPGRKNVIFVALQVRGGTNHYLHISEAAFIPPERLQATLETVPLDGYVTSETTANGLNHFYDGWIDPESNYENFFFPWYLHAEYRIKTDKIKWTPEERELSKKALVHGIAIDDEQIAFRRFKLRELKNGFFEEYPEDDISCFLTSGNNPFDLITLNQIIQEQPKKPLEIDNCAGININIFKRSELNKIYIIGADPAEGVKSDNSAMTMVCVDDREVVATFASNTLNPTQFAQVLFHVGKMYSRGTRWPILIVERNNHGHAVLLKLEELQYPKLWLDDDERPGHRTTVLSRPLLVDTFVNLVEERFFTINCRQILSECLTLVDNNGKIEAEVGKHDDRIISTALAFKVALKYLPKINMYKDLDKAILV